MSCPEAGIDLIKEFEGCRLTAYQDQKGIWTIGYGHTGDDVYDGLKWTEDEADDNLVADIENKAYNYVVKLVKVKLNDNQLSALCSLCYNIGAGNFGNSTLLKILNAGNYDGVPYQFSRWNKVNRITDVGLTRRRQAEIDLWNEGVDYVAANT